MENIIKKRLIYEIKNSKLTIRQIAEKVGVSPEMSTQYTTTNKLPRLDTFAKICKTLEVSANYMLGLEE